MKRRHVSDADAAIRITTAPSAKEEDTARRQRRYLISMAVRVVCFVSAAALFEGWLRYLLMVGAILIPYVAVVFANNEDTRTDSFNLKPPSAKELPRNDRQALP